MKISEIERIYYMTQTDRDETKDAKDTSAALDSLVDERHWLDGLSFKEKDAFFMAVTAMQEAYDRQGFVAGFKYAFHLMAEVGATGGMNGQSNQCGSGTD
ncbi:MAG: hypothetical protein IJT94_05920 [Oscillibacter sp.]|nr:hypothetical protein [Oscillibacter sp.]